MPSAAKQGVSLREISWLTEDFDRLAAEARRDDHSFLDRMRQEWAAEVNRFDRPGERLLGLFQGTQLLAIGGLNRDPYAARPKTGRLRHLYVSESARRSGLASLLVDALLSEAPRHFDLVRLRTGNPAAAAFYLKKGFKAVQEEDATHHLDLAAVLSSGRKRG